MAENELLKIIQQAKDENWTELDLSGNQLTTVPSELGQLANLTDLRLSSNQLTAIPTELGQLTNLRTLDLSGNQLTSVPPEIGQLASLQTLRLSSNQLTAIPTELGQLTNLRTLDLSGNQLTSVPPEIGQLASLKTLRLSGNQLTSVPPEIGHLTHLQHLGIFKNRLTTLPESLSTLNELRTLDIMGNNITTLPDCFGECPNLHSIGLGDGIGGNPLHELPRCLHRLKYLDDLWAVSCDLKSIPDWLGELTLLKTLRLSKNSLIDLSPSLAKLEHLETLFLNNNQLTSVPAELGQLKNLTNLNLSGNQLTILPAELGQLENLEILNLSDNPIENVPKEILNQGTKAILAFLRDLAKEERFKWEAKVLIVGEAGVGKTELVKTLQGDDFGGETATEGVLVRPLDIKHPTESDVNMRLNMWDFGGQEIQHATHQFFYTERALFVLAWNARENYEQAKLSEWLERIQSRASILADEETGKEGWKAPVLLVATHRDLWRPDIPYHELQKQFPNLNFLGMVSISNKTRKDIDELRRKLAEEASKLPIMGIPWPIDWQDAEDRLDELKRNENRIKLETLWKLMEDAGVSQESREPLARYLNEMGKLHIFLDDEKLRNTVVLNPQWLTNRIARVLKNEDKNNKPICKYAILKRKHWKVFWPEEDKETHRLFVQMMRNFDMVYELGDKLGEEWLVVQLLPYQLDEKDNKRQHDLWQQLRIKGQREISMKFCMEQSIPPGIPTWFIAREHRFSTDLHWRLGVLLADNPNEPLHLGRVQSFPEQRYVKLTVRGPMPHNFFVLLRDGLEYTLNRFKGLKITRTVPCPGINDQGCVYEFDFNRLKKAIEIEPPVFDIQCQEEFKSVPILKLLFGIHWQITNQDVMKRIEEMEEKTLKGILLTEIKELKKLSQREFLRQYNRDQSLSESYCPNVFAVMPKDQQGWLKNIFGQKMLLQLYCQAPGHWHPTYAEGRYEIKQSAEWLRVMSPYIVKLAGLMKFVVPFVGPAVGMASATYAEDFKHQLKMMEQLAGTLRDSKDFHAAEYMEDIGKAGRMEQAEGASLRALRQLLDEVDKKQHWGGLKKILTPEGHYLWLCEEHAEEYK